MTDQSDSALGGGEMGALIRSTDWSTTKLGPMDRWPQSLRTMLGVILGSRFPMLLWWGPDLLHLYNDAYRPILRDKHPASLAAPAAEVWAEVWDVAGPMARSVLAGGPATWTEDLQLFINSGSMAEETYFTFSYSPVPGDDGRIGGLLNTVQETTKQVQGEREIRMFSDLVARGSDAKSEADAYRIAIEVLSDNELDLPFVLLYSTSPDGDDARLVGAKGWPEHEGRAQPVDWPLAVAIRTAQEIVIDNLAGRFGELPIGRWNARPERAIVLPLCRPGQTGPRAVMVAGLSPHRAFDDRYRQFFRSTADQVMTIVANARAVAAEKERAEARAEQDLAANRELEAFSYSVAHDLRAPLRAIEGFSQVIQEEHGEALNDEARRYFDRVRGAATRMGHLIDDLLALSRISMAPLHRQQVDVSALARSVLAELQERDQQRQVEVRVEDGLAASADPRLLAVVFDNLLGNAWKFTSKCAHARIEVQLAGDGRDRVFSVRDNGAGFDMARAKMLFAPFQRLHSTDEFEGTGIGLATVQRVVHRHGGRVWVESAKNEGTTVFFTLGDG